MTTDQFASWKRHLKGEDVKSPYPIDPGFYPEAGFYRIRRRDKKTLVVTHVPASYWYEAPDMTVPFWWDKPDAVLNCLINGREMDDLRAREQWPWASKNPISHALYVSVTNGGNWPEDDAKLAETEKKKADAEADRIARTDPTVLGQQEQARGIGDNGPPTDPLEILKEQIESARAGASAYAEIQSDAQLVRAQTLRSRLLELSGEADEKRKVEKDPHKLAAEAVDAKWMPLVKLAKGCADGIRAAMEAWDTKKLQARRAEEAKVAEAERARLAAIAKAGKEAAESGKPAPPPPPQQLPLPPAPTTIRGAAGRAASSKPQMVVTGISNIDAVFYALKDHPEVKPWLMALGQRAINAGKDIPGLIVEERAKVV